MKKALMVAPAASVFRSFCGKNIEVLKNLGYEIYLASNFKDKDIKKQGQYKLFAKDCKNNGIKIIDIPFKRKAFFGNIAPIRILKKLIGAENFDLIHCHTETGGLITRLAVSKKCRAKKIYTPHGISFYKGGSFFRWLAFAPLERWICSGADKVIAINKEEYEILEKWKNCGAVFVHGIGVDIKKFNTLDGEKSKRDEFGISAEDFLILCVGELNGNKNHKAVINALAEIDNPAVKCVICGAGSARDELLSMIKDKRLSKRVFLVGYRTDVPELMACADIFVFPSFHEGLPVSVMEAMAVGLPVVCSKIRGNVDLIEEGMGGFLCNPESPEQFRKAIERLWGDRELRREMSRFNMEKVKQYDIERVREELTLIYQDG